MLSWIQRHALMVLIRKDGASVKELRPADVPNNLFAYHLENLVKDGYIVKAGRGVYSLTDKGLKLIGSFSTKTSTQQDNLKTVILLFSINDKNETLLFRWNRQPYIGKVTLPYDRVHFSKSLEESLNDAMTEKLGKVVPISYVSNVLLKIQHDDELISHMNALVYKVDAIELSLPFSARNGEAFWGKISETKDSMDGLSNLAQHINEAREPKEIILKF